MNLVVEVKSVFAQKTQRRRINFMRLRAQERDVERLGRVLRRSRSFQAKRKKERGKKHHENNNNNGQLLSIGRMSSKPAGTVVEEAMAPVVVAEAEAEAVSLSSARKQHTPSATTAWDATTSRRSVYRTSMAGANWSARRPIPVSSQSMATNDAPRMAASSCGQAAAAFRVSMCTTFGALSAISLILSFVYAC